MEELSRRNLVELLDLLIERVTFERNGVKLYDAVIRKVEQSGDERARSLLDSLREHREEEKEHEEWLEKQIRQLGGDPHAMSGRAQLVTVESEGLEHVILNGDPSVPHVFHALLAAELVDNSGWQLLLQLADEADDDDAREEFRKRLHDEEDHLMLVRKAVSAYAAQDVLGMSASIEADPSV